MRTEVPSYDALASIYDVVMDHVDYVAWARHVQTLLRRHAPKAVRLLELGGGTGTLAVHLQPRGGYDYVLTDGSAAMLRRAEAKIDAFNVSVRTAQVGFTSLSRDAAGLNAPVDAVVCVYDGLNYLLTLDAVADLLARVHDVLRPGGVFVFDQSTPANSEDHDGNFRDEGTGDGYAYVRESHYDAETQRHVTTFEIQTGGETVRERHVQRAYEVEEIRDVLSASPLDVVTAYDGFTLASAEPRSHRVHWVARRPDAR